MTEACCFENSFKRVSVCVCVCGHRWNRDVKNSTRVAHESFENSKNKTSFSTAARAADVSHIPEMCRVAYACSAVEALRWIAWVGLELTVLARVSC